MISPQSLQDGCFIIELAQAKRGGGALPLMVNFKIVGRTFR